MGPLESRICVELTVMGSANLICTGETILVIKASLASDSSIRWRHGPEILSEWLLNFCSS